MRYFAINVSGGSGRLVTLMLPLNTCTVPSRLCAGNVRSGDVAAGLTVKPRKESFCSRRLYDAFAVSRVRHHGKLMPPAKLNVCALFSGAVEMSPVAGAPVASAPQPGLAAVSAAVRPKHGLSAVTARKPLLKTDNVYPVCSCQLSRANVARS